MGCDIHMYIEYQDKKQNDINYWSSFGEGINPGRNYYMFGILAKGVRSDIKKGFKIKGLPDNLGTSSFDDNVMYISDDEDNDRNINTCTMEQANSYIQYGSKFIFNNLEPTWVTNPDLHSHSWLTTKEYEKALKIFNSNKETYPMIEYEAILAAMKRMEELGKRVRIVFWFDN